MNTKMILKTTLSFFFALLFIFLPLIVSGDYRWQQGWWYCIIALIFTIVSRIFAVRKNSDLARERASFLAAEGI